jgi:hypothetical protein
MRLRPAFEDCDVIYATVDAAYREDLPPGTSFEIVNDATRWNKAGLLALAWRVASVIRRHRPHAIVTTGAAPGYFAVRFGSLIGARTVWVDSIANADEVSLSGRRVGRAATLWLTQWPHLEGSCGTHGPLYRGSVL